jgi:uncharacterized protein YggE
LAASGVIYIENLKGGYYMKRKWLVTIGIFMMLIIVVGGLVGCTSAGGSLDIKGSLNSQQEGIWVNGEGKVSVTPDVAILSVGVEAQATSVAAAQSQSQAAMDKLMTALKSSGIAEKDIQTSYFNIQQVTRWDNVKQEQIITGYKVTNMVTAKIRDVGKAGAVIDAVTAAGGDLTRVNSISFTIDDPSKFRAQAREKAVTDAAAKAKQLANAAGVKLGKPIYITESSYVPTVYRDTVALKAEAASGATTSISAGELEVTANVQIAYEID